LVRHFQFMRPLTVSLLTQRRTTQPYGRFGGGSGMSGRNIRHHADGRAEVLGSVVSYDAAAGEALTIETPGGGGWGVAVEAP
jgi:5-oxoprolinase (ATP-hydrolysing)